MKVLLRDLDIVNRRRPFPNLALMKLSAYHKARGDEVFLNFPLCQPDIIYASCVFTWHRKRQEGLPPSASIGGAGIDPSRKLPNHIERLMPDYNLYPGIDFSLGFTSRGCIRRCPWCIVPEKEGGINHVARIYEFWDRRHKQVRILDNNFLASPGWRTTVDDLLKEGLEVDFNQGLDIRLVDDEVAWGLSKLNIKKLRFSFDSLSYESAVRRGIDLLKRRGINSRKLSFYVLVGFDGDDTPIERMKILASLNVDVYPMLYRGKNGKEPERKIYEIGDIFWHGSRQNINKFLRVVGRLPE